jgi:hypothetical protein
VDDVEMSAYSRGLDLENNADITRISKFHFWPYNDGQNNTLAGENAFWDPSVVGLYATGNAGIYVSDSFFISGTDVDLVSSNAIVNFTNTSFDGFGVVRVSDGAGGNIVSIEGASFYQGASNGTSYNCSQPALSIGGAGADVSITDSKFYRSCSGYPIVSVSANAAYDPRYSKLSIAGSTFNDSSAASGTASMFTFAGTASPWNVTLAHNEMGYQNQLTYSHPMLVLTGTTVSLNFTGNQNNGFGIGTWLSIPSDGTHIVSANKFANGDGTTTWTNSFPAIRQVGQYEDAKARYGLSDAVVTLTSGTYSTDSRSTSFLCNAAAGFVTVDLPFAANAPNAKFTMLKTDSVANNCSLQPGSGDNINGSASPISTSTQYGVITVRSDGINWYEF